MLTRNHPLNRLQDEMKQVFGLFGYKDDRSHVVAPRLNVWEENDILTAEMEVPGFSLEELEIFVSEGNRLSIRGERTAQTEEDKRVWHYREKTHEQFHREMTLPFEVDTAKVEAKLTNGVLTITLPKSEAIKPHRIEVKPQ
jgi:HSP20 family protein